MAVGAPALLSVSAPGGALKVDVEVGRDIEVEVAVGVRIEEDAARGPALVTNA